MSAATETKSLTLRLKPALYEAAVGLAAKRSQSLNRLIQESIEQKIREDEDREMFEAAELLGQFPEECDVSYAFAHQAELALQVEFKQD